MRKPSCLEHACSVGMIDRIFNALIALLVLFGRCLSLHWYRFNQFHIFKLIILAIKPVTPIFSKEGFFSYCISRFEQIFLANSLTATKFVFFLSTCLALDRVSSREYFLRLRRTLAFTAAMVWSYTKQVCFSLSTGTVSSSANTLRHHQLLDIPPPRSHARTGEGKTDLSYVGSRAYFCVLAQSVSIDGWDGTGLERKQIRFGSSRPMFIAVLISCLRRLMLAD